jgi:hypothetical protein
LPERAWTSSGKDGSGGKMLMSGGVGVFVVKAKSKQVPAMKIAKPISKTFFII